MHASFEASDLTLDSSTVQTLYERGPDMTLAALADDFKCQVRRAGLEEQRFEVSLQIWHTLQLVGAVQAKTASTVDPVEPLGLSAVVASLEYFLYELSKDCEINNKLRPIELRYNPFLTHWVEVVEALRDQVNAPMSTVNESITSTYYETICKVRLAVVEAILRDIPDELKELEASTPRQLIDHSGIYPIICLKPYYEILYETSVWDRPVATIDGMEDHLQPGQISDYDGIFCIETKNRGKAALVPQEHTMHGKKTQLTVQKDIEYALRSKPSAAYSYLTHLSMDINNLELVNGIIASPVLTDLGISPVELARDFIQHALRDIEVMMTEHGNESEVDRDNTPQGAPVLPAQSTTYASSPPLDFPLSRASSSAAGPSRHDDTPLKGDRDVQVRAVKLLTLFLRNLLKKGIADAGPTGLLFEIEELCVRYLFVPEVREFRRWIEGEDVVDDGEMQPLALGG